MKDYIYNDNGSLNVNLKEHKRNNKFDYKKVDIIENKIYDIFPKNFYKLKEKKNFYIKSKQKIIYNEVNDINAKNKEILKNLSSSSFINRIKEDLSKTNINSYILRIYKKFIINGTFLSSAIVYNFMKRELRFMIKGMPEDILEKCDKNSFPENFINTISLYRKKGLIIIVYASKLINMEEFNDLNDYDYYLNDLTFCGFITLKHKFQIKTKYAIDNLKKLNCNLIINSGDNEYNCLSSGFENGIIDNKNIFCFDIENDNKIIIRKIYNNKYINEEKEEVNNSFDKISQLSNININNISSSKKNQKKNYLKYSNSLNRSSKYDDSKISNSSKEIKENKQMKIPTIKLENENKFYSQKQFGIKKNREKTKLIKEYNSENEKLNSNSQNSDIRTNKNEKKVKKSIGKLNNVNSLNSLNKSFTNDSKKYNYQKNDII